ncbi:MAG: PP2C family protein-serine/threonine phosphatase [Ignavibacteriaceae bacterium]
MIEPKIFYRKLDFLLNRIGHEKTGKDFLFTIVKELENTFGSDLRIVKGRVYEEEENDYVLISPAENFKNIKVTTMIPKESEPVKALMKSKSYIFDNPSFTIDPSINSNRKEYSIPAAFTIRGTEDQWIVIFELKSGWVREEIEFCFNAVRNALNSRIYSEAVKNEIEQAVLIQQSLLPTSAPVIPGYQISGFSQPAELVGGDLYDYFKFDETSFGFCIGDASGHGIPAALLVRDVVTGLRMGLEKEMKTVFTLKKLNRVIHKSVYSSLFVSLFYADLEINGNLFYVNAGHPIPFLVSGKEVTLLESTGLIFGALPEVSIHQTYVFIKPGSVLVLYSDGIIERQNRQKEEFGLERLKDVVIKNQKKNANEILNEVFNSARKFGNSNKWDDDATVIIIKRDELPHSLDKK